MDPSQERDRALIKQGLEKAAQERNISYDAAVSQVAQESREHIQADNISGDNGGALVPQIVSGGSVIVVIKFLWGEHGTGEMFLLF